MLSKIQPKAPPIKSQGIKTRLVPLIAQAIRWDGKGRWIEPFLGSGTVLFNIAPHCAYAADSNTHLINFYRAVQRKEITAESVRSFLESEGSLLQQTHGDHYCLVRDRFNTHQHPLDFLFLNRSCFNRVIRFNAKGKFNVPFCRKPDRFRAAYITKICNQVAWLAAKLHQKDWIFVCRDWRETLSTVTRQDFVYIDPPYIGRHTDYYHRWTDKDADALAECLRQLPCSFAYSMWKGNIYRQNPHLQKWFADYPTVTYAHFYHVGSHQTFRHAMEEALVLSKDA
jgi:DNA adenine methylase